ncbi:MAG: D-tyrosyl-tRNA(Tyr) deacylase [SAR324 cluster bacterium]|nr:D-tyrosyl-tRNA(Tyr) deacylase [SAR324 cluster bacterium]
MRVVLQRVREARVTVDEQTLGQIGPGLLLFTGITHDDRQSNAEFLAEKCINLRVFEDEHGKMNRSCLECQGEILVVSQFTLYGNCQKGRRPGFDQAAPPSLAQELYDYFVQILQKSSLNIQTGRFQATMQVHLINDGPVTLILEK